MTRKTSTADNCVHASKGRLSWSSEDEALVMLSRAVASWDSTGVRELTNWLLHRGVEAFKVVNDGLMVGMNEASDKFRKGEVYIPELLMSSRALKVGLDILKPRMQEGRDVIPGTVVIGTVQYDIHDIGKSMVATLLAAHGFEVVDLGVDIPPKKFIKAIERYDARILALSSLLTSTMASMKETIEQVHSCGLRGRVKVIVGGAPITPVFAKNIGADAYCRYGTAAPSMAKKLLEIAESAP